MRSIKNLKDPTWIGRQALLLLICVSVLGAGGEIQANLLGKRTRRDYNGNNFDDGQQQNVTCDFHETKFSCNCKNARQPMQLPHLIGYAYQVEVSNCNSFTVGANALEDTQGLRKIKFKDIDNLTLRKFALAFPRYASNTPLIVEFEKVNFELIDSHAINGNIEEISFIGGRIGVINPFGFTTLKDRAVILKMENVLVKKIEPQAFKKFAVEQMEITNCVFEQNVPSKAFYELEILNSLHIHNVKFREVHTRAFSFKMISKLIITNNYFEAVDGEWIEAYVRDNVIIRENYFGRTSVIAFKGIRVHRDYMSSERLELRLTNNTIISPYEQPRALEFTEPFAVNIKQLRYENEFDCKDLDTTQKPPKPRNQFFLSNIDNIFFYKMGFNTSRDANNYNQSFVVLGKIIETDCQQRSYLVYIVLGLVGLVLLLLIIAIGVCVCIVKKRRRRKLDVVVPEPRTYKETQIVYQIENAGLLKTDL